VPLWHNTGVLDTLEVGGGAVVISVVHVETPSAILPQGAIPFSVVRFFVTTFEAVGERGALAFPFALVLGYGA